MSADTFPGTCRTCSQPITMARDPVTRRWRPMQGEPGALVTHRCATFRQGQSFERPCRTCGASVTIRWTGGAWSVLDGSGVHRCGSVAAGSGETATRTPAVVKPVERPPAWRAPRRTRRTERGEILVRTIRAADGFEDDVPFLDGEG